MRSVKVFCAILLAGIVCSAHVYADSLNFYFMPSEDMGEGIEMNDSTPTPRGYPVLPIKTAATVPGIPTTNLPHYLDVAHGEVHAPGLGTFEIGWENSLGDGDVLPDGEFSAEVAILGPGWGGMRFFSASTIAGAAYYNNSDWAQLRDVSGDNYQSVAVVLDRVNPAYIIPFTEAPFSPPMAPNTVEGIVYASATGHTNQLESAWIVVEWSDDDAVTWTNALVGVGADGSFSFATHYVVETDILVRARVKDAHTPRNGFPISASYPVTVVPEPGILLGVGLIILGIIRRRVC